MVVRPRFAQAAGDLVPQVRGRDAVALLRDLVLRREAGIQERLLDVAPHGPRVVRVVREVAALGRDEDLVAPRGAGRERLRQRAADGALALLAAVVDRRIEDVDAGAEPGRDARLVARVHRRAVVAEVRAQADRGQRESHRLPEVPVGGARALREPARAFRRRPRLTSRRGGYQVAAARPRQRWITIGERRARHADRALARRSAGRRIPVALVEEPEVRPARAEDGVGVRAEPVREDRAVVRAKIVLDLQVPVGVQVPELRRAAVDARGSRRRRRRSAARPFRDRCRSSRCPGRAGRTRTTS